MGIWDMTRSAWINLPALVQDVGKILLPLNLSVLPTLHDTTVSYGAAALALLLLAVVLTPGKRWSRLTFGSVWFALFLLPSFILHSTTVGDLILEHRAYLPMAGFLIMFMEAAPARHWAGRQTEAAAWGAVVLSLLSVITWNHIGSFRDRMSFWDDAARTSPHLPLAHRNLGAMYYLDGRLDDAESEYKIAIALNPAEPMVHSNLGLIYMNKNRLPEAEDELRKEVAVNPTYENGYFNLGLLYYRLGRSAQAVALWEKTLTLNPENVDANADLAIYYHSQGNLEKTALHLGRLKVISPQTYLNLSGALEKNP
jgi:lipoprotein NlpI